MLCAPQAALPIPTVFQSSSSPKAGCYWLAKKFEWIPKGFNPHPARRLDAIWSKIHLRNCHQVSILIQPEGWMLYSAFGEGNTSAEFQSSSSPKAGCYKPLAAPPAPMLVSILIQPEGWMLCPEPAMSSSVSVFQSSSSPKAGCYSTITLLNLSLSCFNPHPARRLDAIWNPSLYSRRIISFNPHPARRLDAIWCTMLDRISTKFQSSSSPKAGCYVSG